MYGSPYGWRKESCAGFIAGLVKESYNTTTAISLSPWFKHFFLNICKTSILMLHFFAGQGRFVS